MKRLKMFYALLALGIPTGLSAQVVDRILFGQDASERAHGLTMYSPEHTEVVADGFLGQSGRASLRFEENPFAGDYPGIYGGEYSFVLRVDGTKQNYLTLRTYGGDGVTEGERYRVQVDNKDLMDYSRDAVSFDANKAPGAFAYNTMIIPRKATDGKTCVVVRVRGVGRYYAYGRKREFETYQRVMKGDLPPIYAAYTTTDPFFGRLADEQAGRVADYASAPAGQQAGDLEALKQTIENGLSAAIKSQVEGYDFKPAYANNNFNIVEAMGTAYQKGYYGTTVSALSAKIRVAIDSMVYINNLTKRGIEVSRSVLGNTATNQTPSAGWGGLYGEQGLGIYQLWLAGQVTDLYLDRVVDLGGGEGRTRREQWIEVFKESFDYGCTRNGRRTITNQAMEAAYSVYGASLALYMLDEERYHNAPRMGLRFLREAVGLEVWTGVPADCSFDGTLTDAEGYPDFQLGDSKDTDTNLNFWGSDFQVMTEKGNGREAGWTCTSCYGSMGPRIIDLYLMTRHDPFIGTAAGGEGDKEILAKAVANEKTQAYFTHPWVAADGGRQIDGEAATCWRNRYEPGKVYYNNLVVAAISGDEELLGHVWHGYMDGREVVKGVTDRLFNYYSRNYYLPECIDKLAEYGKTHGSDYARMPSAPSEPDYVEGDAQAGIVAVKHGGTYLFVNFYSEASLGSCGRVHVITGEEVRNAAFVPDVMEYVPSGHTEIIADVYWNGNHQITYPDNPQMADGGTVYDVPAYDGVAGHYNSMRTMCEFYQQRFDAYIVAQNTTADKSYTLQLAPELVGARAVNVATGEELVMADGMEVAPRTSVAYFLPDYAASPVLEEPQPAEADVTALQARVGELSAFACAASDSLSEDKRNGYYSRDAFMPFFRTLTLANYVVGSGLYDQAGVDAMATELEAAYEAFVGTRYVYDACAVPGTLDYRKRIAQGGALQVRSATTVASAMNGAYLLVPVKAEESGDYTVTVQARGHVYDEREPSLNVDIFTDAQYLEGNMPISEAKTQQVAYAMAGYSTYRWYIRLEAGETQMLKFMFLANTDGYTVDLGKASVALSTAYDRLQQKIISADSLLAAYAGSELVTDAQRAALSGAITEAQGVPATASEAEVLAASDKLETAMARFRAGVATWKYPVADIQFRINHMGQSGDGASFEVRNSSSSVRDNGFVGGIKFDVSGLAGQKALSATLGVTTLERGCQVSVRPFSADWGETGGQVDSYAAKQACIEEALAGEEIAQFAAAQGGGRKMFEWIPSRDYTYTVADWRVDVDVTDALLGCLEDGKDEFSLLFVPADNGSTRTTIVCKDVCEATFGTSTTDDYYLSGDQMGEKNGQSVTRWSRVEQLLAQDDSPVSSLYPSLTVEIDTSVGVETVVLKGVSPQDGVVYDLLGRVVDVRPSSDGGHDGLRPGIYIKGGKKFIVR